MINQFISSVKNIYELLGDELSREIYINRLNYLFTGEKKYVENYVMANHSGIPVRNNEKEEAFLDLFPDECNVVFYGMGRFACQVVRFLTNARFNVYFTDSDSRAGTFGKYEIISIEDALKLDNSFVVICTTKYYEDVKCLLKKCGISDVKIVDIRGYFTCGSGDEYFYEDFLQYTDNEIFIDAGCCDLESSIDICRRCGSIKKIYAFEPDPDNYEICCKKLEQLGDSFPKTQIFSYGTWNEADELHFEASHDGSARIGAGDTIIRTVAIDDIVDKEDNITFIKMDVEGAELQSLEGAKKTIIKSKPKLAICIYHKPEDMVKLPEFILDLQLDYKLYIRSYSNAEHEEVLYAV